MFICRTEEADRITSGHARPLAETTGFTECELTASELSARTWPGPVTPYLPLMCRTDKSVTLSYLCVSSHHVWCNSAAMTYTDASSRLQAFPPAYGPITGSAGGARPSQSASAGSSCPSIISADRHADGRNASCGSHKRRASTMRRETFISNLRDEKAEVSVQAEET